MDTSSSLSQTRSFKWSELSEELLGKFHSGQELLLASENEEDHAKTLSHLFEELEVMCWEQFEARNQALAKQAERKAELASLDSELEGCISRTVTLENKIIQTLDSLNRTAAIEHSSQQSTTSIQTLEGQRDTASRLKSKGQSRELPTKESTCKTIRLIEGKLNSCMEKISQSTLITGNSSRQELVGSLKAKALECKLQNLETLESIKASQLSYVKKEIGKAQLAILRKKRNLEAVTELLNETEVLK